MEAKIMLVFNYELGYNTLMINLIIKFLLLFLGVYLITIGHWGWALIPLLIVISMSLAIGLVAFFVFCLVLILLTGCTTYNVSNEFPNSRINVSVQTPIGVIYPQSIVESIKPKVRNPNDPYRNQK